MSKASAITNPKKYISTQPSLIFGSSAITSWFDRVAHLFPEQQHLLFQVLSSQARLFRATGATQADALHGEGKLAMFQVMEEIGEKTCFKDVLRVFNKMWIDMVQHGLD